MAISNARVVGSNYSTFRWNGHAIAYLEKISDSGVSPYSNSAPIEAIHPLGEEHPTEFAVARILNFGRLSLTIRELWEKPVWQHLFGLTAALDLLDVWKTLAADPSPVTCQTVIKPPQGSFYRVKTYHNVVVETVDDSEMVTIGSMSIPRDIGCVYTHATREIVPDLAAALAAP